ncbi:cyclic di-GMP phosphodiesterase [Betaproteobacteria bacterium]|nr:cyclic di-GMP phosphodiesterase [Betaproteobacteria bacterium]GHT99170.1 cyclic di-GMP phosphodiesterase [Betaproteobacteria bacterium]GHU01095.1 cyclic di-GMP phosphodiesterase [Betaproteobacteria bacterium]GHU14553.1 cyclic di-GMP phosphodiesterase [Betaproteobacteria bacterium]GHU17991.1 cyclic di-GMP phosphodiesterase [Betaproteobacteria bacterium]
MIKLIPISRLAVGMFVHDLNCDWIEHNFIRNHFLINNEKTLQRVLALNIKEIYIDVSKGGDVAEAPTQAEAERQIDVQIEAIAHNPPDIQLKPVTLGEEKKRAKKLHAEANRIVHGMMNDVRLGKQIEIEQIEPVVERIVNSIFQQQDALLPLARLKNHDEYTFQHSVSVCALMTSFARALDLSREVIREIAIGALLHDTGKATIPDALLNKPGKLTDAEFDQMKSHVVQSKIILEATPGISPVALAVAAQHHERFDGTGYPNKLKGEDISLYGQMGAIVDVYDAITSNRCYHKGMPPTEALRKLLEWSKFHFKPELVQVFIRTLGIYPTGSLVRLESGRLAIVEEQHADQLVQPTVNVIFHTKGYYLTPERVDLRRSQDRIVGHEDFEQWEIDPEKWVVAGA